MSTGWVLELCFGSENSVDRLYEFADDGANGLSVGFAFGAEVVEEFSEGVLRMFVPDCGAGCVPEHVPEETVAVPRNVSLPFAQPGLTACGISAEVGFQGIGRLEAANVADRDQGSGGGQGADAGNGVDAGRILVIELAVNLFDFPDDLFALQQEALELLLSSQLHFSGRGSGAVVESCDLVAEPGHGVAKAVAFVQPERQVFPHQIGLHTGFFEDFGPGEGNSVRAA